MQGIVYKNNKNNKNNKYYIGVYYFIKYTTIIYNKTI